MIIKAYHIFLLQYLSIVSAYHMFFLPLWAGAFYLRHISVNAVVFEDKECLWRGLVLGADEVAVVTCHYETFLSHCAFVASTKNHT